MNQQNSFLGWCIKPPAPTQKAGPQGDGMRDMGFHWWEQGYHRLWDATWEGTSGYGLRVVNVKPGGGLDAGSGRVTEKTGRKGYLGKLKVLIPDSRRAQDPENISQHLFKTELSQLVYKPSRIHKNTLQGGHEMRLPRDAKIEAQWGYVSCPRRLG